MNTTLQCIPCFTKQILHIASIISHNPDVQEQIIRAALQTLSNANYNQSPPYIAKEIHAQVREITKNSDPYKEIKRHYNQFLMQLYPSLKKKINDSHNPFETAVRLAVAGNVIDFGINNDITEEIVKNTIHQFLTKEIACNDLDQLREAVHSSKKILYLADNAGEIVLDRLLLEILPKNKITFAVKGSPILNDVTMEDAIDTGITEIVDVIENGADAPGTILDICSEQFIHIFNQADLIISKGQGNFETLNEVKNKQIYFLFKVKCISVAKVSGLNIGDIVIKKHLL